MTIENDPSARIQFRRQSELQMPGSCYICGNGNCEEGYVDFTTHIDWHGAFYLCMTCFEQSVHAVGYFTPEEVKNQLAELDRVLAVNVNLLLELDEARGFADRAAELLGSSFASTSANAVGVVSEATTGESERKPESDPKPTGKPAGGESESEEPVKIPGRKQSVGSAARDITFE